MNDSGDSIHFAEETETLSNRGRDPFDQLAEEFAEECRKGRSPSISEYEARYPEFVAKIRKLLPTVAMMEQLKRGEIHARAIASAPVIPDRLGEYRVIRELGRGGMGVVYEAVQESLGRHVALKVIHTIHLDAKRLQRFQREAQVVARFHHANIVPVFGVGEHEGVPYLVMQCIKGNGLDVLLANWRREGPLAGPDRWRYLARFGIQAAEGLQYAHDQGVLHRDIKPANLLIDEYDTIWITDFGLAKLIGQDDLTASGDVIGTLRYIAPEALRGETDPRSDVYSLGLTLYESLTLCPPFGDLTTSELLRHVSEEQPTPPRKLDRNIPRELETIVLKAIAREPRDRYSTAGALADDLNCFLQDRPIHARRATSLERIWRWGRRNKATAALASAAVGSLVLAAVVGWVGYMSTMTALESESRRRGAAEIATMRSEQNVALSLEVFQELFDQLASHDSLPPPPLGQPGRGRSPAFGPRGGAHEHPPSPDDNAPPRRPPPNGRSMGGPPGPLRRELTESDNRMLSTVLTFYDRFARQNATDPKLQGEAAWAYRKVGILNQQLGHDDEAEKAFARAIEIFEELVSTYPGNPEYRSKLVDTYDMADPWTADANSLETLERRLQRARTLIDQAASESPDDVDSRLAQVHVHAKLGVTLQRLNRLDAAETAYRRAITLAGDLIESSPRGGRPRLDRAITQEALAILELDRGRRDEARTLLDAAATDLQSLAGGREKAPPPPDRFEHLASAYEQLGESERAVSMRQWAKTVRTRRPEGPSGPRDRGPGSHTSTNGSP